MTRLPVESWNIKPRLDLPPYELNQACPITGEVTGLDNHHIVRKSFTALGREDNEKLYWVELDDGEVIGNRIRLSSQAHFRITTNRAAIVFANGVYYWEEVGERVPLRWQPPTLHRRKTPTLSEGEVNITWVPSNTWAADPEAQELGGYAEAPSEGEECKLCRRRVPHKKKASSPSTKVFSCRIPIDSSDEFNDILDGVAEGTGLKSQPHHQYWTLLYGLIALGQLPEGELPRRG